MRVARLMSLAFRLLAAGLRLRCVTFGIGF
jgi:hypothetical protein